MVTIKSFKQKSGEKWSKLMQSTKDLRDRIWAGAGRIPDREGGENGDDAR